MPFSLFIDDLPVLPLRGIIFQCLLLLVAIALEAIVLRRQLRLGFQPSIRYASTLNLLAVVLGWIAFFIVEPLLPDALKLQVINYILFGDFFENALSENIEIALVMVGLFIFFLTFWVKAKALEWLTWLLGNPIVKPAEEDKAKRFRYRRSPQAKIASSPHLLAVLQANALSFTAVLLLLSLRYALG
jgi:hypothetical protein